MDRSKKAYADYSNGLRANITACLAGVSRHTSGWVPGVLEVENRKITWHEFGRLSGLVIEAQSFEASGLRQVVDRESWLVGPESAVVMGDFGEALVEIAVLQDDMAIVLDALRAEHLLKE